MFLYSFKKDKMPSLKNIIITILSIFIIIYIICYFIPPKTISINQTKLLNFKFNLLYERHPLIIYDQISNLTDIKNKWFQYNITNQTTCENIKWIRNCHKYLVLSPFEDSEIHICNPYTNIVNGIPCTDTKILSINLKKNQIVIIPYRWYVYTDFNSEILHVHDIITYLTSYFV